jgi:biopolymer transport protein ExbD
VAGAQQAGTDDPITDINVTPLVDVSLVLVIIFMAIAPFALTSGIKVLESKAKAAVGKVSKSESVNIKLELSGRLTVNGKETDFSGLGMEVAKALNGKDPKKAMTILTADEENKVGDVVRILDISKQFGAKKIAILHSPKKKAKGKKG